MLIETRPGTRLTHLFYNFRKPKSHPLSDPRVREALSYAIDGETLIREILQGSVVQAQGVVPPDLAGAATVGEYRYDPDKARQLLQSLGVRDLGLKIILSPPRAPCWRAAPERAPRPTRTRLRPPLTRSPA